jgi:hypothetical protein
VRNDPTTLSRLRGSLTPQVLVAERAVSVRLILGHEQRGLTARLWRSCGNARKTSRIARSCRLCRRCHISRYRRTVCTAARSGTCDQREGGVRHLTAVRRNPKKKRKVVCFKADARERGALPRRRRTGRGRSSRPRGPACSSAARARVASTSLRLPATRAGRIGRRAHGARAAPDRADQSPLLPLGLFPSAGRRAAAAAALIAGAATRRGAVEAAKFFSARPARGLFLLCAHGHEAIMSSHGDAEDMKRS